MGMAKAKANGILLGSAFSTVEGKTSISSAKGPQGGQEAGALNDDTYIGFFDHM